MSAVGRRGCKVFTSSLPIRPSPQKTNRYHPSILVSVSLCVCSVLIVVLPWVSPNSHGLFNFAQATLPLLLASVDSSPHPPTLLVTGATASLRGGVKFADFAAGKFAKRAITQSECTFVSDLDPNTFLISPMLLGRIEYLLRPLDVVPSSRHFPPLLAFLQSIRVLTLSRSCEGVWTPRRARRARHHRRGH